MRILLAKSGANCSQIPLLLSINLRKNVFQVRKYDDLLLINSGKIDFKIANKIL